MKLSAVEILLQIAKSAALHFWHEANISASLLTYFKILFEHMIDILCIKMVFGVVREKYLDVY